jgi:L-ectoine synthase
MFIRKRKEIGGIQWGNGTSHRMLTKEDGMGFTVAHTVVNAGSESRLQYLRHLEACYCISGRGSVTSADGSEHYVIEPGHIYVLDKHDPHILKADADQNLHLVSVFNPPLTGEEQHHLSEDGFSQY